MNNPKLPSWVDQGAMSHGGPLQTVPNVGSRVLMASMNTHGFDNKMGMKGNINEPPKWDGMGINPAHKQLMEGLPPQLQQFLQMFMNGGNKGFMGFEPVDHNPWTVNQGNNVAQWNNPNEGSNGGGMFGGS